MAGRERHAGHIRRLNAVGPRVPKSIRESQAWGENYARPSLRAVIALPTLDSAERFASSATGNHRGRLVPQHAGLGAGRIRPRLDSRSGDHRSAKPQAWATASAHQEVKVAWDNYSASTPARSPAGPLLGRRLTRLASCPALMMGTVVTAWQVARPRLSPSTGSVTAVPPVRAHLAVRAHRCALTVALVVLLAAACSLTAPTRAFARQINRAAPSDESSALLFSAGWSRSQQSGIWMINADGSGLGRIAAVGRDTSWSPDGRLIAYVSADHWMIERTDGSGRYRVPLPVAQHASWGDRHELLAYRAAAGTGGDQSVIYSIDAGARHATRRVLERTIDSVTASVVESPTGSGYAYGTEVGDVWFTQVPGKPALCE